jgi:energy-coupling factor transport system substrate-specific component
MTTKPRRFYTLSKYGTSVVFLYSQEGGVNKLDFKLKDIVYMAITAAAMMVVSFFTVPLVVALPIPGIRTIVVAPFYGLLIALAVVKIKKVGTCTIVSTLCGLPLAFISPVILMFCVASGITADLVFFLLGRDALNRAKVSIVGGTYMGTMMVYGELMGALILRDTPISAVLQNPLVLLLTFVLSAVLGALGSLLATRI